MCFFMSYAILDTAVMSGTGCLQGPPWSSGGFRTGSPRPGESSHLKERKLARVLKGSWRRLSLENPPGDRPGGGVGGEGWGGGVEGGGVEGEGHSSPSINHEHLGLLWYFL